MLRFEPVEYLPSRRSIYRSTSLAAKYSPSQHGLLGIDFMMQIGHRFEIFHVHRDLLVRFAVQNSKRGFHLDFVLMPRAKKGSNDSCLAICSSQVMVKDGKEDHGVDGDFAGSASINVRVEKSFVLRTARLTHS